MVRSASSRVSNHEATTKRTGSSELENALDSVRQAAAQCLLFGNGPEDVNRRAQQIGAFADGGKPLQINLEDLGAAVEL
jgi:hypothetical protein